MIGDEILLAVFQTISKTTVKQEHRLARNLKNAYWTVFPGDDAQRFRYSSTLLTSSCHSASAMNGLNPSA
jgi:hypothetical protein